MTSSPKFSSRNASTSLSSSKGSLIGMARIIFVVAIGFSLVGMWQMHFSRLKSLSTSLGYYNLDEFNSDENLRHSIRRQQYRLVDLASQVNKIQNANKMVRDEEGNLESQNQVAPPELKELLQQLKEERKKVAETQAALQDLIEKSNAKFLDSENNLEEERKKVAETQAALQDLVEKSNAKFLESENNLEEERNRVSETQRALQNLVDKSNSNFLGSENNLQNIVKQVSKLRGNIPDQSSRSLKIHIWDDTTHLSPREDLLMAEGWFQYNGKAIGDKDDSTTPPWFESTDDPWEADLIIWITVMGRHNLEKPPADPIMHAHKVIVLDYADGCTIHEQRRNMREHQTELAYFKRSFTTHNGPNNTMDGTCIDSYKNAGYPPIIYEELKPFQYCGSNAMMVPLDSPEANPLFQVVHDDRALIYGKVVSFINSERKNYTNEDNGYFKDKRHENFLVPYRDRKWNVVNILRYNEHESNARRNKIVEWTQEFSMEKAGNPRKDDDFRRELESWTGNDAGDKNDQEGYTAYVGEIHAMCEGYCFGRNYLRHLRNSKIVVTCNPSMWEGDFRLWEAFLSGALVMINKMHIPQWMPDTPQHGKHFVVYDQNNKTDFMEKLKYYSNPVNIVEAEAIAKCGYEFVLRHHMAVNRVDYVLDEVRDKLIEYIEDPLKRELLHLPPKEGI